MTRAALWLLQLSLSVAQQPPAPPKPITVRIASGAARSLAVATRGDGEYVRADRLAEVLGGSLAPVAGSLRSRLRIGDVVFELTADAGFARLDGEVLPLASAPEPDDARLWLPIQFVTDVLPRAARGLLFDAERRELRAMPAVAASKSEPPSTTVPARRPPAAPGVTPVDRSEAPLARVPVRPKGTHVVVVDAGHGGVDSGMHGSLGGGVGLDEKNVTLAVARQLRDALQRRGIDVVMTRTRDTLIALSDRGRIANQQRGELFVSIHVNAANPASRDAAGTRGFETYFLADAKSEDARRVAARENESERFETSTVASAADPLGFIISDMAQNEHLRESSRFATLVQRRLAKAHPGPSRGVKQAGFKVLVSASMPSILVEVGYGTNVADGAFMSSARGQQAIAEAIADAAVEYLGRADRGALDAAVP